MCYEMEQKYSFNCGVLIWKEKRNLIPCDLDFRLANKLIGKLSIKIPNSHRELCP